MKTACLVLALVGYCAAATICTLEYSPRCGVDGKVYSNGCMLRAANVEEAESFEVCRGHEHCPRACTKEYNPVCGSDGKTYSTACVMQSLNCGKLLTVAHHGRCEDQQYQSGVICTLEYAPVCGADGKVYSNRCFMRASNAEEAESFEVCRGDELCPLACTREYNPVCGSDGKTYATKCVMQSQNCGKLLSVAHYGQCEDNQQQAAPGIICTMEYNPVCGADGKVYSNPCLLRGSNVEEAESFEVCRRENHPLCPLICTMEYAPVCGDDGKTYATKCVMQSENCGKRLAIKHYGECEVEQHQYQVTDNLICTMEYAPVCGVDGKVYPNRCLMRGSGVQEAQSFEVCREANHQLCPQICTLEYNPVCGEDGKTYATACAMHSENCGKSLRVAHMGECQVAQICPLLYAPVCGADGKVYDNQCYLKGANVEQAESFETCRSTNSELCPAFCTREYAPVCGSDKKIYPTACVMRSQNCGKFMLVLPMEECQQEQAAEAACPKIYKPVCAVDGHVYDNSCLLRAAGLEEAANFETCRSANHPLCPQICTAEYRPVCGTDGKIYATECVMRSQNCGKRLGTQPLDQCQ